MRVNSAKTVNFNGFLNSKALLKTAEFAADNGALFAAGTSLILSTFVRPIAILATPKAQKENKEYACAKSIASSLVGFGVMALISNPIIRAVQNIENSPAEFLSEAAIQKLQGAAKDLPSSSRFKFSAQLFKLGSAFVSILPKAILTSALIPPVMALFFNKKPPVDKPQTEENVSFGAAPRVKNSLYQTFTEKISSFFGKILNNPKVQHFAQKYDKSNFPQHMFSASDIISTAVFAKCTMNNRRIDENRKKTLIYNASIMTGLTVAGGYLTDWLLKKPTEIFIEKFKKANAASPKLDKYIEGIKIAKPALILGVMYYMLAPVASTILAEKFSNGSKK